MSKEHKQNQSAQTSEDQPSAPGLTRRRFMQVAGAAGVAAGVGPLIISRPTRAADKKTLKILQWSHFVPSYDTWFDQFAKEWGENNGVEVVVDHINLADLVTTTTSEISAGSGHDLIELGAEAANFAPSVLSMEDINQEVANQLGPRFGITKRVSYNPTNNFWYAFCHGWTIDAGDYRKSLWTKAGVPQGPDTWQQLLDVGSQIRDKQGVQVGIGMSQELDSNMASRALLWAWDTYVQDEWDNVVIDQGIFKRRAVEALKYATDLYKRAMTPEIFAWNAASNNQALIAGRASYILNSISAYRSAQDKTPDIAKDVFFVQPLAGPNGTRWGNVHILYNYIMPKFAKAKEDTAKQFIKYLAENYDQAMYNSKLYNSPCFYNAPVPGGDRGYPTVENAKTFRDLNDAWFTHDPFKLKEEADGKLKPLITVPQVTTNLGHPGYSNPAVGEVFNTFVLPNMFAKVARGQQKPEEAVDEAGKAARRVYESWRKRGIIGGGKS